MMKRWGIFFLVSLILVSAMCSGCGAIRLASELAKLTAASPLPTAVSASPTPAVSAYAPGITVTPGRIDAGKWDNNIYTNVYTGLQFTLPQGWTRFDNKTMALWNDKPELNYDGTEDITDTLDDGELALFCMRRNDKEAHADLSVTRLADSLRLCEDAELVSAMLDNLTKPGGEYTYENDGMVRTVTLGGETYYILTVQALSKKENFWVIIAFRCTTDCIVQIYSEAPTCEEALSVLSCFGGYDGLTDPVAITALFAAATTSKLDVGKWNGNVYTNSYTNLTFTLPDGWQRYTDAELADFNSAFSVQLDGTGFIEIEDLGVSGVALFIAHSKDSSILGYLLIQPLSASEKAMDDETFLKQLMELHQQIGEYQYQNDPNTETLTLGGAQYWLFFSKAVTGESQKQNKAAWSATAVRRMGDAQAVLYAVAPTREGARSFIDSFS